MEEFLKNKLFEQGPLVVLLILILVAGAKRYWVWGYQLAEAKAEGQREIDEWKAIAAKWETHAMKGAIVADNAVKLATTPKN